MIVDRRKDHYDELLVMARDARVSRARTNRWTTGLVVAAMAAGGAYVAATNNEVEQLRQAKEAADAEVEQLNIDLNRLLVDNEALRVERDIYRQNADWFADLSPSLNVDSRLGDIAAALGGEDTPRAQPTRAPAQFALSNLVWYVDGSRRFPMAANDVLWIPEGQFWVKLNPPGSPGALPTQITVYKGERVPPEEPPAYTVVGTFRIDGRLYYEREASRQGANCVQLEIADSSGRGMFGAGYVDMVVTYVNKPVCANAVLGPRE